MFLPCNLRVKKVLLDSKTYIYITNSIYVSFRKCNSFLSKSQNLLSIILHLVKDDWGAQACAPTHQLFSWVLLTSKTQKIHFSLNLIKCLLASKP